MAHPQGSQTSRRLSTPMTLKRKPATVDAAMAEWWYLLSTHPEFLRDCERVRKALLLHATVKAEGFFTQAIVQREWEISEAEWAAVGEYGSLIASPEPIDLSEEAISRCLAERCTAHTHLDPDDLNVLAGNICIWLSEGVRWLIGRYGHLATTAPAQVRLQLPLAWVLLHSKWGAGAEHLPRPATDTQFVYAGIWSGIFLTDQVGNQLERVFRGAPLWEAQPDNKWVQVGPAPRVGNRILLDLPLDCSEVAFTKASNQAREEAVRRGYIRKAVRDAHRPRGVEQDLARYRGYYAWSVADRQAGNPERGRISRFLEALGEPFQEIEGGWSNDEETNRRMCKKARTLFGSRSGGLPRFSELKRDVRLIPHGFDLIYGDEGEMPF